MTNSSRSKIIVGVDYGTTYTGENCKYSSSCGGETAFCADKVAIQESVM